MNRIALIFSLITLACGSGSSSDADAGTPPADAGIVDAGVVDAGDPDAVSGSADGPECEHQACIRCER